METHYNNPKSDTDGSKGGSGTTSSGNGGDSSIVNTRQKADSSGLKLYYTTNLRKHDAGVLSIGKLLFHKKKINK